MVSVFLGFSDKFDLEDQLSKLLRLAVRDDMEFGISATEEWTYIVVSSAYCIQEVFGAND